MSLMKAVDIGCDECLAWVGVGAPNAAEAREVAQQSGWVRVDGRDLCPKCALEEMARLAERAGIPVTRAQKGNS